MSDGISDIAAGSGINTHQLSTKLPLQEREQDSASRTVTVFAFLWAMFTLFHQAKPAFWARTPIEALQTAAAIAILFRPTSLTAFLSLIFLQLTDLLFTLPNITNHSMFAMFVDLTIVLAVVIELVRNPNRTVSKPALYQLFAPAIRIQVIILYFFVVLHKLNSDFLSTVASCSVDHYLHLSGLIRRVVGTSLLPDGEIVRLGVVSMTLLVELGIPVLLLFRRTRVAGVALGLLFHYVLGINIFHDFSGMIFALYLLFLPSNFVDEARTWWKEASARLGLNAIQLRLSASALSPGVWVTLGVIGALLVTRNTWSMLHPIFLAIWIVYGALCILTFGAIVWSRSQSFAYPPSAFRIHRGLWIVPFLVVVNGIVPYVGLKTENSFAMFSNLRTEGGTTNHLLIPVSAQIFGYQKDLVTVLRSSDVYLQGLADRAVAVPFYTLREHVSRRRRSGVKNVDVVYIRAGVEQSIRNAETNPELSSPHSWLERKFLVFREVDSGAHQMCKH